ncbi:hypothetical protein HMPREF1019_00349 [Campylobacter sp. 10_1_50]|nr:hypothetical protein HMPREF1019_00349 [Campylobacter sp. 10_1_50]
MRYKANYNYLKDKVVELIIQNLYHISKTLCR